MAGPETFGEKLGTVLEQREVERDALRKEIEQLRGQADYFEENIEQLASARAWMGDLRYGSNFASNQRKWLEEDIGHLRRHADYFERNFEEVARVRTAQHFKGFGDGNRMKEYFGKQTIRNSEKHPDTR